MIKNKFNLLIFIISIITISMSLLSAEVECVDDATDAYLGFGGCAQVIGVFGQACDATFPADGSGVVVGTECPITCNMCPGVCGDGIYDWDETGANCPEDVPGCDIPDRHISISADGMVLFNSSLIIGGFQFYLDGAVADSSHEGEAGSAGLAVSTNSESGKVLGFSIAGATISPGCGILTKLMDMTGTPTGIFDEIVGGTNKTIVVSDADGLDLDFSYDPSYIGQMLSIIKYSPNIPTEFTISQNFPNPFNPVTSIAFDITEINEISLIVYDLSGKEVITLASGRFTPGSYRVNWNAVNNFGDPIASGMYMYRYVSGKKAITRKMLYMK